MDNTTTTVYLVRHGAYENPQHVFPGNLPGFPLSEEGINQSERSAKFFKNKGVTTIYSSPLLRTQQTADIFGKILHLPVKVDEHLTEVRTVADGISMTRFDETNGELSYTPEYRAKGAESMDELVARMDGFIQEKIKKYTGRKLLIVTHGDPMRFVTMHYMGLPITFSASRQVAIPLAGGYQIDFDDRFQPTVHPIVYPIVYP